VNNLSPLPPELSAAEADALARALLELSRHRPGRLAGARLSVPGGSDRFGELVAERLAARGCPDVRVAIKVGPGPRVLSIEMER